MLDINILYNILMHENVCDYEKELFELIPELMYEKGFDQRSEWHIFDVWNHTLATINACDMNYEDRLVMLLHDIGKPFSYQDDGDIRHFKDHAKKSAIIAKNVLDRTNIDELKKVVILKLIELHASKINTNEINLDNIDFYKRLLKIQTCDAKGYEEEHSKQILNQLNVIKKLIYM